MYGIKGWAGTIRDMHHIRVCIDWWNPQWLGNPNTKPLYTMQYNIINRS